MSTTTEQNKTVIRGFLEAWNNRQPEAFDEFIACGSVRRRPCCVCRWQRDAHR